MICKIHLVPGHIFSGICIRGTADERRQTQMSVCRGLIRVHPCSSAVCESCFPGKKSRKTFGRVLIKEHADGVIFKIFVQSRSSKNAMMHLKSSSQPLRLTTKPIKCVSGICSKYLEISKSFIDNIGTQNRSFYDIRMDPRLNGSI